ncbi:MAG: tetratricopeptide repeat protein [Nibricoccus sp.]
MAQFPFGHFPVFAALVIASFSCVRLTAAEPAEIESAQKLFAQNHWPEAKAAFEKLAAAEPQNAELQFWLGKTALSANAIEAAVAALEKATALDPKQARYFHQLGDVYGTAAQKASLFDKMDYAKKCIAAYDRAVALDPENVEYRKSRYEFYRSAPAMVGGGAGKAAAEIAEIEKRDPVQGSGLRADLLLKNQKVDEAFALLDALRAKHPQSKVAGYLYGRLTAMTGEHLDEGESALRNYFTYEPTTSEPPLWAAHWRLAQVLERKENTVEARAEYEKTLELNPSFERARTALKKLPK